MAGPDAARTAVAAEQFRYGYDAIGNRKWTKDAADPNRTYGVSSLNEYTTVRLRTSPEQTQRYEYDAGANLSEAWLAGDMNRDGVVNFADISAFIPLLGGQ